jgi:hypothetical protein
MGSWLFAGKILEKGVLRDVPNTDVEPKLLAGL